MVERQAPAAGVAFTAQEFELEHCAIVAARIGAVRPGGGHGARDAVQAAASIPMHAARKTVSSRLYAPPARCMSPAHSGTPRLAGGATTASTLNSELLMNAFPQAGPNRAKAR
jgi:hypothetical protein